ncbi:MAG TPA: DUF4388 domain-containing protein [Chloroflexota bacterium]|nr:DUF4388 domain-containing protein [Chloroflexota bacterium]HUM67846.1 DUF4388 domain-containing protein [Chloroflexota bacterium]
MAIQGNLHDVSLPTLVQLVIHEGDQAVIQIRHADQVGALYLADGRLCHAALASKGQPDAARSGEEVVYELLSWQEGHFTIEKRVPPPAYTIETGWDYLLMEGLRILDERHVAIQDRAPADDNITDLLSGLSETDKAVLKEMMAQKEIDDMASKGEQIQAILDNLVRSSTDITGAVVVDSDGLLLASVLGNGVDGNRVAAVSAGLVSLAGRSAQQLNQGNIRQTLIQAENGNIIAVRAGERASFVALTASSVNLGMVFMECRDAADAIRAAL